MAIPIRNIYYLLCYAWDRLEARNLIDVGTIPGDRVENLLAKVMQVGVARLIRQGLDRGYLPFEDEGRRLRGKVLFAPSVARCLLQQGKVRCLVDELSHNVPHNRVLKAAMRTLIESPDVARSLRSGLRDHCRMMSEVADVELSPALFREVQLHRNVAHYAFLMNVARLVGDSFVPAKHGHSARFHPFTEDPRELGRVFGFFVRNFLRREQKVFDVSAEKVLWDATGPKPDLDWLPEMKTDVVLRSTLARIVIEAKCYEKPYQTSYDTAKLRSGHLYQLQSYLSHLSAIPGPTPQGVLLYAAVGGSQRRDYRLRGYDVRVRTLDLNREWPEIHDELLAIVGELNTPMAAATVA